MPFIYKPSLWGFGASAIFLVMMFMAIQDTRWMDSLMWGLLGISYLIKYMPKFVIFGAPAFMVSFFTLIVGGAMFFFDAAQQIQQGKGG
ncbi:MAG: hypothetical protein O2788_05205 [Chloroflexi bacterium]|nr:hypothetical protein [Chloroflexota bacterium]